MLKTLNFSIMGNGNEYLVLSFSSHRNSEGKKHSNRKVTAREGEHLSSMADHWAKKAAEAILKNSVHHAECMIRLQTSIFNPRAIVMNTAGKWHRSM